MSVFRHRATNDPVLILWMCNLLWNILHFLLLLCKTIEINQRMQTSQKASYCIKYWKALNIILELEKTDVVTREKI